MIGDSAYRIKSRLMKLFAHNTDLTTEQRTYDNQVCRVRIVTEIAYGRLKARWRHLSKRNDMNIDNIPHVITAACVLHNICEVHHEHRNDVWLQPGEEYAQPDAVLTRDASTGLPQDIRNALVQYSQNNYCFVIILI